MSHIDLKNLSLTIFGESHSPMIGGVITGFPSGFPLAKPAVYPEEGGGYSKSCIGYFGRRYHRRAALCID